MEEFPPRPSGMHRATYQRLEELDDEMQWRWASAVFARFGRRQRENVAVLRRDGKPKKFRPDDALRAHERHRNSRWWARHGGDLTSRAEPQKA